MIHFFCLLHAPEDDLAPADFSYVRSVSEGRRRAQLQPIHPDALRPAQPMVDEYGIPENPFAAPEAPRMAEPRPAAQPQPQRRSRVERYHAEQEKPVEGSAKPREIPDWLRTAQQNNMPLMDRPVQPRVQAAPRRPAPQQASPYEAAGYPPELVAQHRYEQQQAAAQPVYRRHGAQYAARPQYAPEPPPQPTGMSYPPPRQAESQPVDAPPPPMARGYMHQPRQEQGWQVETDEEIVSRELPGWIRRVPWLGIAAFAAVMAAVLLWIMGMNYEKQTQQVLDERAAQQLAIEEAHPLKYSDIIAAKAERYNLSPAFIAAIMLNESSFRPEAVAESTGARGLMQLKEDSAEWIHGKLDDGTPFRFDDLYDPSVNAEHGCWYLNYLSTLFRGDPVLVAAAYHAGQGEVRNWLQNAAYSPDGLTVVIDKIPFSDTRRYVTRVMNAYAAYLRLYYGG